VDFRDDAVGRVGLEHHQQDSRDDDLHDDAENELNDERQEVCALPECSGAACVTAILSARHCDWAAIRIARRNGFCGPGCEHERDLL
jgi:hypothetical protein